MLRRVLNKLLINYKQMDIVLENTKEEMVGIYDTNDVKIGETTRREMRKNNLIHRSTNIIIEDEGKNILIQKRSSKKEYCPSYYDIVFGGVVGSKEIDMDSSAQRELSEELGLDGDGIRMKFIGKILYEDDICRAWAYIYNTTITKDLASSIKFCDGEVDSVEWKSKEDIMKMIQDKEKITPDSVDVFHYFLENNNI